MSHAPSHSADYPLLRLAVRLAFEDEHRIGLLIGEDEMEEFIALDGVGKCEEAFAQFRVLLSRFQLAEFPLVFEVLDLRAGVKGAAVGGESFVGE